MPNSTDSSRSTGLNPNVAGALAYLLSPITGILFLVLERRSAFVRFHAAQSIVIAAGWIGFWIALMVVETMLGFIPAISRTVLALGVLLSVAFFFGGLALWLLLMYRAYQGEQWELPLAGGYAHRLASVAVEQSRAS